MHWHADNSSYGLLLQGYATSPTIQVCQLHREFMVDHIAYYR